MPFLKENCPFSQPWHAVVRATPALHERELAKTAALVVSLAAALKALVVADLPAALAARIGMDVFAHATTAWLENPKPALGQRLTATWSELNALLTSTGE